MTAVVAYARPRAAAGDSLSKVAGELGLKAETLRRWCSSSSPNKDASQSRAAVSVPRPDALTFVRLEAMVPPVPASTGVPVEIVFAGGVSVRVPVGFDEPTLSRVVSVIKGAA
jgi:transposase-like protein